MLGMYLKCHKRFKDGMERRYWCIAESVRTRNGVSTRQVLYLGEINDSQRVQWCSAIEVVDGGGSGVRQMSMFPEDRTPPPEAVNPVDVHFPTTDDRSSCCHATHSRTRISRYSSIGSICASLNSLRPASKPLPENEM
jgi:hypothetical protein